MEPRFSASYTFHRSTNLEMMWLSEDETVLTVRFQGRPTLYHYTAKEDSPLTAAQAFGQMFREDSGTGSAGNYLNSHMKPNFDFTKEEPEAAPADEAPVAATIPASEVWA